MRRTKMMKKIQKKRKKQKKRNRKNLRIIQKKRRTQILKTILLLRTSLPQLLKVKVKQMRRMFLRKNNQTVLYMGNGQTGQDVCKLVRIGKKKRSCYMFSEVSENTLGQLSQDLRISYFIF